MPRTGLREAPSGENGLERRTTRRGGRVVLSQDARRSEPVELCEAKPYGDDRTRCNDRPPMSVACGHIVAELPE